MEQQTSHLDLGAVFQSTLLDASGQPNLVIDSTQSHELVWTLVNTAMGAGQDLVVTPFNSGPVGSNQYHFLFGFAPGALTDAPTLQGWDVAVQKDGSGGITSLYIVLAGSMPLSIPPSGHHTATLTYTNAIQEDSNKSKVAVTLTAGSQVTLAGTPIQGKSYGPFNLTLVQANTPTLSAPPLAVDFVGRRTVLNDGRTPNSFTFALTNMTQVDLPLTPKVGGADVSPTVFTVWFDAAPNQHQPAQHYPWALAKVENLASEDVVLTVPSSDWTATKALAEAEVIAGNPQWAITVSKVVVLGPQDPVFFTFTGIRTDLDPGVTRMYLRYENLPGFHDGVLIGELEKTPLLYGIASGQGLYLSAGTPQDNTPPTPNYDSGLYIQQFGDAPTATFNGGCGVSMHVAQGPAATFDAQTLSVAQFTSPNPVGTGVQMVNRSTGGKTWQFLSSGSDTPAGTGKLLIQEVTGTHPVATFQSDGNVGIGTPTPKRALHVAGDYYGKGHMWLHAFEGDGKDGTAYVQARDDSGTKHLALQLRTQNAGKVTEALRITAAGDVGIGTTTPCIKLDVGLNQYIGTSASSGADEHDPANCGPKVSFGYYKPTAPIGEFVGMRCSVERSTNHVGNAGNAGRISFHTWEYNVATPLEVMSITGKGDVGIGTTTPCIKLDVGLDQYIGTSASAGADEHDPANCGPKVSFGYYHPTPPNHGQPIGEFVGMRCSVERSTNHVGNAGNAGRISFHTWEYNVAYSREVMSITGKGDVYVHGGLIYNDNDNGTWRRVGAWGNGDPPWAVLWSVPAPSDLRFKSEVQAVPSALDKIRHLRGVTYRWNEAALRYFTSDIESTISAGPHATEVEHQKVWQTARAQQYKALAHTHIGVVAQDVEAVLPEAVSTDAAGYKSVWYHHLIALLIEAIKEQDLAVTAQAALAAQQQSDIERLKQALLTANAQRAR